MKYCDKEMLQIKIKFEHDLYTIITSLVYEEPLRDAFIIAIKGHLETNDKDVFLIGDKIEVIQKG
jgi:hypothetical protein